MKVIYIDVAIRDSLLTMTPQVILLKTVVLDKADPYLMQTPTEVYSTLTENITGRQSHN